MIVEVDFDKNGMVDFDEFVCLMTKILTQRDKDEEELITVFKRFDVNGDGTLSWDDLHTIFAELGHDVDEAEAKEMIHFFDRNNDGDINFDEFV